MHTGSEHPELDGLEAELRDPLERYLEGSASPEDVQTIRDWIAGDTAHAELVERIVKARRLTRAAPRLWDSDEAWTRLVATAEGRPRADVVPLRPRSISQPTAKAPKDGPAHPATVRTGSTRRRLKAALRIAAGVAAVAAGAVIWQQRAAMLEPTEIPVREVAAGVGERIRITLSDETEIVLGSASRVWIPEQFGREREVQLEGEAVFEVTAEPERPFVVRTERSVTRVLGTRFGVHAFDEDGYVEVTVAEGRVSVAASRAHDERTDSEAVPARSLGAGHAIRVEADGSLSSPRGVDAERLLAWTQDHLYFERAPLSEVARTLERRFGTRIELDGSELADLRLTAEFETTAPVAEIVEHITLSLAIEVRETPGGFLLSHPDAAADRIHEGESNR